MRNTFFGIIFASVILLLPYMLPRCYNFRRFQQLCECDTAAVKKIFLAPPSEWLTVQCKQTASQLYVYLLNS